jgi:hypothetical protein
MAMEFLTSTASEGKPKASLQKGGNIYLNRPARNLLKLKRDDFVILGYDKKTNEIGIKRSTPEVIGSKRISSKNNGNALIYCLHFLDHFGIRPTETLAYPAKLKQKTIVFKIGN